jgi:hypothetical protein
VLGLGQRDRRPFHEWDLADVPDKGSVDGDDGGSDAGIR